MPTERNPRMPAVSRSTAVFMFGSLLAVVAIRLFELAPAPYGPAASGLLRAVGPISAVVAVLLLAFAVAAAAALRGRPREMAAAGEEEPLLAEPRLPKSRARCPLISFVDLEPGAGASTIAFNLGVLFATEGSPRLEGGRPRRPRPLCLLAEGALTEALGLDPEPLREHLATYPGRVTQDIIDLAVRQPSGCELLCVPRGQMGRHQLRLLRDAVERYYDALIVDCSSADSWLREGVEDVSDAIVLVALPDSVSAEAAVRGAERALAGHRLATMALLVNRIRAKQDLPEPMTAGFENVAQIPDDRVIAPSDRQGMPWCLLALSSASRQLRQIATSLLPDVFIEEHDAA